MTGPITGAVDYASADGLGVIRLNRPQARTAIDPAFVDDLHEAVQRCAADETLRALLIRAEGPSFTVGGDVAMLARTGPGELPPRACAETAQIVARQVAERYPADLTPRP